MTPRNRVAAAGAGLVALLVLVGGIALVASYWHARALAHAYRSPLDTVPDLSAVLPLTTDGLLFGAFAVIYWRRIAGMTVPRLAWIGAGLAGAGTVAANLATAHRSVTGWIVAGWAPLTFTLVDFLVALLIPPLVKAWRDAPRDVVTPQPVPRPDTPTIAMTAPAVQSGSPWARPPDIPGFFAGTGSLFPVIPPEDEIPPGVDAPLGPGPDDWGTHPADVPDDVEVIERVPARPNGWDRVRAARTDEPAVSTRWTEDDERVRAEVQDLLDRGELAAVPSARWFRNNHAGMGSERAKRIIAQLRPKAA